MKEKDFQSKFGKWIRENTDSLEIKPAVYELKFEKGKSFALDNVREHQVESLLAAKHTGLYHKISDLPVFHGSGTRFATKKPFDCFYVRGIAAYLVIGFYTPRQKIEAVFMDINRFIEAKEWYLKEGHKSIPKQHLKQMSNKFFRI